LPIQRGIDHQFLDRLRLLGKIEGTSTLVLFGIAMPLKYLAGMPLAVSIVGAVHGLLFLALVYAFFIARSRVPMPTSLALLGVASAVVPFGPFMLDSRLARIGQA
jgi:integral membrane protein